MSKHTNKYWIREKEYISLMKEDAELWKIRCENRNYRNPSKREIEIDSILVSKFYNEHNGRYNTAPKWYRKMLNRIQRAKSKQALYNLIANDNDDYIFEGNYKDCSWYW